MDRRVGLGVCVDFDVDLAARSAWVELRSKGTYIVQVLDRIRLELLLCSVLLKSERQQSKLLAPVSQVVYPDDFPSVGFVQVGEERADDG